MLVLIQISVLVLVILLDFTNFALVISWNKISLGCTNLFQLMLLYFKQGYCS